MEDYAAIRKFVFVEGKSRREAARIFGLHRETVSKICRFSVPPGYVRQKPPGKPKLGPVPRDNQREKAASIRMRMPLVA